MSLDQTSQFATIPRPRTLYINVTTTHYTPFLRSSLITQSQVSSTNHRTTRSEVLNTRQFLAITYNHWVREFSPSRVYRVERRTDRTVPQGGRRANDLPAVRSVHPARAGSCCQSAHYQYRHSSNGTLGCSSCSLHPGVFTLIY